MSANWTQYFEHKNTVIDGKNVDWYVYNDKGVIALPVDNPMPPTTNMSGMFRDCKHIQDISALANWDTSKVTDAKGMFNNCCMDMDLTPLLWSLHNHNVPITGSPTIMFHWEINKLKAHITRLEEQITELTNIIEQQQKEKATAWYQPIIDLFSAD